jgi:hypothetical protein
MWRATLWIASRSCCHNPGLAAYGREPGPSITAPTRASAKSGVNGIKEVIVEVDWRINEQAFALLSVSERNAVLVEGAGRVLGLYVSSC